MNTTGMRRFSSADKITLRDIARESVNVVSEKMHRLPDKYLHDLKNQLKLLLEGNGTGSRNREVFLILQKFVRTRSDLTEKTLIRAHRLQLEILVAINTGIKAFLHPKIRLSQTSLIDVFLYKRCRNIACQNRLPSEGCTCEICANRTGFCNNCMCVLCNKFDFEVNTCRWIGCNECSHWTHTDCAIRDGRICTVPSVKTVASGTIEMVFRCGACDRTCEMLGWVKDIFLNCAKDWDRDAFTRELGLVSRIFRGSDEHRMKKLFWKCEELLDKMRCGLPESAACSVILIFFQELDVDSSASPENGQGGRLIAPREACNQIVDVLQGALRKMEMVADEKMRMCKIARQSLEACDRELEDKAKEVAELNMERQRKKMHIKELEKIASLKQAEADMFQLKATKAKREAEGLRRIDVAKSNKSGEDFSSSYLKLRLNGAEAEKQHLFEKLKMQENCRRSNG